MRAIPVGLPQITPFIIFLSLIYLSFICRANDEQDRLYGAIHWIGYTYHPGGGNSPEIYPLKLDDQGTNVVEVGLVGKLDYRFSSDFYLRSAVAAYKDCAFNNAGFFHLGFRGTFFKHASHSISGGLGPTLLFRRDWNRFPEYKGDEFFSDSVYRGWQYRFIWYGGEFDYSYQINSKLQFQYSVIPGYPFVFTNTFGIRYRF